MTAAVGTGNPAFLMVCERQNLRECFLAGVTEELVLGHWDLRVGVKGGGWSVSPCMGGGSHVSGAGGLGGSGHAGARRGRVTSEPHPQPRLMGEGRRAVFAN